MTQIEASSSCTTQPRVKQEGFSRLLESFYSKSDVDVSECYRLLDACKCDEHYFIAFAYLPKILKLKVLSESENCKIIKVLPINLLRRMIVDQKSDNWKSYRDLAMDILSVLLPNCSAEDALKFECLIEPLHASIVSQRDWDVRKLEDACNAFLRISNGILDVDDVAEIIEVISKTLYDHTEELPSLILLRVIIELLRRLMDEPEYISEGGFSGGTSPSNLRIVIRRLLQTNCLPEEYRSICFNLCAILVCILGYGWFEADPQFLILMAALTYVQLRVILDDPKLIRLEELVPCATLGESFIQCVEEGRFLNDEQAKIVSRSCHDSIAYICEYMVECRKDEGIEIDMSVEIVLYRFVCSFLAVGGQHILNRSLVKDVLPALIDIARRSCECGDASVVEMLFPSLPTFDSLSSSCLKLIVMCLERQQVIIGDNPLFKKIANLVNELKSRSDWYTREDLSSAKAIVQKMGNRDLTEAFSALH